MCMHVCIITRMPFWLFTHMAAELCSDSLSPYGIVGPRSVLSAQCVYRRRA